MMMFLSSRGIYSTIAPSVLLTESPVETLTCQGNRALYALASDDNDAVDLLTKVC